MYNDIVKWSLERDLVFLSERYIRHDSLLMWMCNRCGEDIKSDWNEISRARTTFVFAGNRNLKKFSIERVKHDIWM